MMITGIFFLLVGTGIGKTLAVNTDVNYEPNKITVKEQIDQSPIAISEQPNFVHQGSNYFFGAPFARPPQYIPLPKPERIEVIEEDIIFTKPQKGKENPPFTNSVIINGKEVIHFPRLPNVSLSMPPYWTVPFVDSPLMSKLALPYLSTLVEKPVRLSNDVVVSEVGVLVEKIPPPPQLPPLRLEEIFQPVLIEENKIILVPPPPKIEAVLPPSIVLGSQPCHPAICAREILYERVLPNIACEKSKKVELISIPASLKQPVVAAPFLPYIINH